MESLERALTMLAKSVEALNAAHDAMTDHLMENDDDGGTFWEDVDPDVDHVRSEIDDMSVQINEFLKLITTRE